MQSLVSNKRSCGEARLVDVKSAAMQLNVHPDTIRKHFYLVRVGHRVMVRVEDIENTLSGKAAASAVERMFECRALGITHKLWKDPLPSGHNPCDLLGEKTFYPQEGDPVSMPMSCVEEVEGTGAEQSFTYQCPYCLDKHKAKAGRVLGGTTIADCGLGVVYCIGPDGFG